MSFTSKPMYLGVIVVASRQKSYDICLTLYSGRKDRFSLLFTLIKCNIDWMNIFIVYIHGFSFTFSFEALFAEQINVPHYKPNLIYVFDNIFIHVLRYCLIQYWQSILPGPPGVWLESNHFLLKGSIKKPHFCKDEHTRSIHQIFSS